MRILFSIAVILFVGCSPLGGNPDGSSGSCQSSSDCQSNQTCSLAGFCIAKPGSCTSDSDCPSDQICSNSGFCKTVNNGSDAGPDAGPHGGSDAGPDAGIDAGMNTSNPHAIGGKCLDSSQQAQSNCNTGLQCLSISELNMCSAFCNQDSDCGDTVNGQSAICWDGLCVPGCDSAAANPCGRTDFACLAGFSEEGDMCFPDCTQQYADFCNNFFGYPVSACSNDGSCVEEADCTSSACPQGQACDTYSAQGTTFNVCAQDCRTAGSSSCSVNSDCTLGACVSGHCQACPFGLSCDSADTHVCQPTPVNNYAPCENGAQCPAGDGYQQFCESFIATSNQPSSGPPQDQLCLTINCSTNSDCTNVPGGTGQTCNQNFGICLRICSPSDAGTTCPSGTACVQLNDSSYDCIPADLQ